MAEKRQTSNETSLDEVMEDISSLRSLLEDQSNQSEVQRKAFDAL